MFNQEDYLHAYFIYFTSSLYILLSLSSCFYFKLNQLTKGIPSSFLLNQSDFAVISVSQSYHVCQTLKLLFSASVSCVRSMPILFQDSSH